MENNKNFRFDINGLRAYAVMLVVLFHFKVKGFQAGFIGVDIFFVISGFLMTGIIIGNLYKDQFSILKFYLARATRIIPAMFVVCVLLLITGWFTLLPSDYQALSKHVLASINFFSNIAYYRESGYFDTSSHNKALLHTWSLSVEWQFYILLPIILVLVNKIDKSKKLIPPLFIVGFMVSLALSVYYTKSNPRFAFYFLPTRFWELLAGGIVFLYGKQFATSATVHKVVEIVGFILILIGCFKFSEFSLWPSYNALLPVLGTIMIIYANQQNSVLTKPAIFQWLGKCSYSIYLWHWPIVFYLNYYDLLDNTTALGLGILGSIVLGYLSYRLVEIPTKDFFARFTLLKNYAIWIISVAILSLLSILVFKKEGIQNRFPAKINNVLNVQKDINPKTEACLTGKKCSYGTGPVALLVIGDSHANAMINGIQAALPKNTSLDAWTIRGCATILGLKRIGPPLTDCGSKVATILKEVEKYPANVPVLIVNRINNAFGGEIENEDVSKPQRYIITPHQAYDKAYEDEMTQAYLNTLAAFAKSHPVYVTRPTPEAQGSVPLILAKDILHDKNESNLRLSMADYQKRSGAAWAAQDKAHQLYNVQIIDVTKSFCDNSYCYFTKDGLPLLHDDDHMSWKGSTLLTPLFKQQIFNNK